MNVMHRHFLCLFILSFIWVRVWMWLAAENPLRVTACSQGWLEFSVPRWVVMTFALDPFAFFFFFVYSNDYCIFPSYQKDWLVHCCNISCIYCKVCTNTVFSCSPSLHVFERSFYLFCGDVRYLSIYCIYFCPWPIIGTVQGPVKFPLL